METQTGLVEREKDSNTDMSGGIKRESHRGIQRKIETQTGVGERERERHGGREKKSTRRTGVGERESER